MTNENVNDILQHHGVKGMSWGDRNGPPYPLDSTKGLSKEEAKVVRKRLAKEEAAKRKAAKRRAEILKSPKLLSKHADEFTTEEIDNAIEKFQNRLRVKAYDKPVELSAKKKLLARDEKSLYKNRNLFTPEEMELALNKIDKDQKAKRARNKSEELNRERAENALRYIDSISNTVGNVSRAATSIANARGSFIDLESKKIGLARTKDERETGKLINRRDRQKLRDEIANFEARQKIEREIDANRLIKDKLDIQKKTHEYKTAEAKEQREMETHLLEKMAKENKERRDQEKHEMDRKNDRTRTLSEARRNKAQFLPNENKAKLEGVNYDIKRLEYRQKLDKAVRTKITSGTYKPINSNKVDSFINKNKSSLDAPISTVSLDEYDWANAWSNYKRK